MYHSKLYKTGFDVAFYLQFQSGVAPQLQHKFSVRKPMYKFI